MRKVLGWGMAILMAFGVVGTAYCADSADKSAKETKTGIVKKVDVAGQKIVVMVARELTFTITKDTKIVQGDVAQTIADIKEGASVTVEYTRASKDSRIAVKIDIAAAPAAAKPAAGK